ncbi:unnamed protein product [Rotaria sp. Silwood1]|nr:unnamed protein product [Rotaria sp. Silwood1]
MILVPYVFILFFTAYLNPCETLKCYECTGYIPCGQGETHLMVDCAGKCMVYRNQYDGGTIIRRCCTNDCGQDGLGTYEGRDPTYFCSQDLCNGAIADGLLPGIIDPLSTTTTTSGLTTNGGSSQQPSSSLSCYDCTGYNPQCGIDESTLIHSCQACMVYLNQFDGNMVIRRCCTSGCGLPGTISDYEGRVTYFCSSNRCNGIGTEATLTGGIAIIERRCCWWACGLSNSISTYNGIQTYFCSNDKCNGYGTENILPPVITTTTSIISLTTTPITTSTCTLNCQNGGVLEIQNPCFCNCVDNTFGFECQYFNCARPDVNPQTCIPENQPLCWQSDIFAYECFHLCGKC